MTKIEDGEEDVNMHVSWLLLSDVPPNTLIGLDTNVWTVGRNFRGVRNIPLGLHYLFINAAANGPEGEVISGPRCGVFLDLSKPCVVKKRWVKESEEFVDLPSTEGDVDLMRSNPTEVKMYLIAYPKERFANWVALSSHITLDTINRLQPSGRYIYSCALFLSEKSMSRDSASLPIPTRLCRSCEGIAASESLARGEEQLPTLRTLPETDLHWTELPQHPLYPPGSSPAQISQYNMDQTYTLNHIIAQLQYPGEQLSSTSALTPAEARLLGEFHFAFVVFLFGEVLEGWYQWRRLFSLLANCERAVVERPRLYKALITSLYRLLMYSASGEVTGSNGADVNVARLLHAGGEENEGRGFPAHFDEWYECHNGPAFLPHTMTRLFGNIAEAAATAPADQIRLVEDLLSRAEGLRVCLERRFNVRLPGRRHSALVDGGLLAEEVDWDTDEAPVIVCD
uniref:Protein AAR2 homolog n=1 Tax=Echinococcus granulosus TaxID=6210 RepID=A0A068WX28_ECHGR|nr:AAR2 [Echinococcus granulosus]